MLNQHRYGTISQVLAVSAIGFFLVAGVGWTIWAGVVLVQPELTTCHIIFPQLKKRPILTATAAIFSLALFRLAAPELSCWKTILLTFALWAEGHLLWPED